MVLIWKKIIKLLVPGHHFLFIFLNLLNFSSRFRTLTLVLIEIVLESWGKLEKFSGNIIVPLLDILGKRFKWRITWSGIQEPPIFSSISHPKPHMWNSGSLAAEPSLIFNNTWNRRNIFHLSKRTHLVWYTWETLSMMGLRWILLRPTALNCTKLLYLL